MKNVQFFLENPRLMDDEIHVEKPTGRDGIIVPFLMQFHGSLNDT
jgi:hypothetical protein